MDAVIEGQPKSAGRDRGSVCGSSQINPVHHISAWDFAAILEDIQICWTATVLRNRVRV
jgi:hypothetical protein